MDKEQLIKKWLNNLKEQNNNNYPKSIKGLKHKSVTKNKELNKIWHQTRLDVLPLNKFLYKIKKSKTDKCSTCKVEEDTNHFLSECKRYDHIWKNNKIKRKRINTNLGTFLNPDKPPPDLYKLLKSIDKCIKIRKPRYNSKKKLNNIF